MTSQDPNPGAIPEAEAPAVGRPLKLTPQVQAKVCQAVRQGNRLEVAAGLAGIGRSTFYRWMETGEKEEQGPFREFRDAVKEAELASQAALVRRWRRLGRDSWQATAALLERRFPDEWGRRDQVRIEAKVRVDGESARETLHRKINSLATALGEEEVPREPESRRD